MCSNLPGSYVCSCESGFKLHNNGRSCLKQRKFCKFVVVTLPHIIIEAFQKLMQQLKIPVLSTMVAASIFVVLVDCAVASLDLP